MEAYSMETAIIYFSRNGSTRIAAELLNEKLKGKIVELKPEKSMKNFFRAGFTAVKQKDLKLKEDPWNEIGSEERLVLISPVWAGRKNPVMNSFIEHSDFSGREVHLLTLQADPQKDSTERVLPLFQEMIVSRGGKVASQFALHGATPGRVAERGTPERTALFLADLMNGTRSFSIRC